MRDAPLRLQRRDLLVEHRHLLLKQRNKPFCADHGIRNRVQWHTGAAQFHDAGQPFDRCGAVAAITVAGALLGA